MIHIKKGVFHQNVSHIPKEAKKIKQEKLKWRNVKLQIVKHTQRITSKDNQEIKGI